MEEKESYRLFEMALALFSKYGIRSVTMEDISNELGVSKKTIYQQVSDKKELVTRVIEHEIERLNRFMNEMNAHSKNAIDELVEVNTFIHAAIGSHSLTFYYDLKKYYPDLFRQWILKRRIMMIDMITDNMVNGKKEGHYREDLDEQVISRLYMARMEMLQENEYTKDEDFSSRHFFREILLYHLHGICSSSGLEHLSQQHHRI